MLAIVIAFADFTDLPMLSKVGVLSSFDCAGTCSTNSPSGNKVGGLPLAVILNMV